MVQKSQIWLKQKSGVNVFQRTQFFQSEFLLGKQS